MPEVQLPIGGRFYAVACAAGAETRVKMLGEVIDSHWAAALRAAGGFNTERAMFLVALMLADKMEEALTRPPSEGTMSEPALHALAERLERLAEALEQAPASA